MSSLTLLKPIIFEKYNCRTEVWGITLFDPFLTRNQDNELICCYSVLSMFHSNKDIAEAYVFGDADVRKRFEFCITGDGSGSNLYWVYRRLQEVYYNHLPSGSFLQFSVPNPDLAGVYRRRIKFVRPVVEVKRNVSIFKIFKP